MTISLRSLIILPVTLSLWVPKAWPADVAPEGSAAYNAKCGSCHGKTGAGNPAMAKVFKVDAAALDMTKKETADKSDADLAKIIKDGINKMPAYKDKLSDADIAGVVAYMRSLAKK